LPLSDDQIKELLVPAAAGDAQAREKVIEHYRPFVLKEAQRVCRRFLDWSNDEELSVALIAFNEAIDAHDHEKGSSFEYFARMVIKRRLVDYFRQKNSGTEESLPGDEVIALSPVEEDWDRSARAEEVGKYKRLLQKYDLDFKKVARLQPRHEKTREDLQRAAKVLAGNKEMMHTLIDSGKLPKKKLCEEAGVTSRMLDRGRAYVIALALLLAGDELPHLKDYAWQLTGKGEGGQR